MDGVRFLYVKHIENPQHILTIAYKEQGQSLVMGWAINKMVSRQSLQLDQRLRMIVGDKEFASMQRRFIKRFKGDQHNKAQARLVASGRLEKNPKIDLRKTDSVRRDVLRFFIQYSAVRAQFVEWQHTLMQLLQEKEQSRKVI